MVLLLKNCECSFGAETVLPASGFIFFHTQNLMLLLLYCYCSFGAETVLPALGSIFFHIHILWCCYLFCFSIMLKQKIVIAVLVLKQCYLHRGQYFLISIEPVVLLFVLF